MMNSFAISPETSTTHAATGSPDTLGQEIRRIRKKLGLTQTEASYLSGGGKSAISRYERGLTRPLAGVMLLFRLLDSHPELLSEVMALRQAENISC